MHVIPDMVYRLGDDLAGLKTGGYDKTGDTLILPLGKHKFFVVEKTVQFLRSRCFFAQRNIQHVNLLFIVNPIFSLHTRQCVEL